MPRETRQRETLPLPKRMGWDLNPRDAFTSAGFQGRQRGLRGLPKGTPLNKAETRLGPSGTGRQAIEARTRIEPNRDTTSQIETTHQTSQRQVAIGPSRNDSKWPGEGSPTLPCSVIAALGLALRGRRSNSALRSLRTACSRFPRGIDAPPGVPLWIPAPEMAWFWRGQVREHPAARRSNPKTISRPRGWPVAAGRVAENTSLAGRQGGPRLPPPTCRQSTEGWRCRRPPQLVA
jgi:hypothetical protein